MHWVYSFEFKIIFVTVELDIAKLSDKWSINEYNVWF